MLRCLYGYGDASLMWYNLLSDTLTNFGYKRCDDEPCLFYKIFDEVYSLTAIVFDDMLIVSKPASANDALLAHLGKHFRMKELGEPRFVLGMHVTRPSLHHITVSQSLYIRKVAEKYKLTGTCPHTPATKDDVPSNGDDPDVPECPDRTKLYRSFIGSLLYCTLTRPDVCVALGDLARIQKPKPRHVRQLKRVGAYLYHTRDLRLQLKPQNVVPGAELDGHGDASFDIDPDTSRSRSGVLAEFANCPIIWIAVYQEFVAFSVAEAEFAALNRTCREIVWLRRVLSEIGFPQQHATAIYCDNSAAITLAEHNIATRPKTKHILRRFNYIREQQDAGRVKAVKVNGVDNPADFFTKVLDKCLFIKGRERFLR